MWHKVWDDVDKRITMKRLITQEWFGIIALTIILIPQVAHTVYVFDQNSQYINPWFAWCYAVGVDLAILIFTVRGWKKTALIYLLGTFAHNIVYQFYPESIYSALLIGVMLSGTIFSFSHLFYAKAPSPHTITEDLQDDLLTQLKQHNVTIEIKPFKCPQCAKSFENSKQLNGHISGHKQTDSWKEADYGDWEAENSKRQQMCEQFEV